MESSLPTRLVNPDPACVAFKSCDGRSIEINKYFLYLYDAFYRSILEDNMEDSLGLVFIIEGATFDELILLKDQIHQKHLQCVDQSKNQISDSTYENPELSKPSADSTYENPELSKPSTDSTFEEPELSKPKPSTDLTNEDPEVSEHQSFDDSLILECPFKCEFIPDSPWTSDILFAHIYSKHASEVKNNFYVSIITFMERLTSKLSSMKCAFQCKSGTVYPDLAALKIHYYRCHAVEPVICSNCGDTFTNPMTYKSHTRDCHVQTKECSLCGKEFKCLRLHMKHFHGEKNIKCQVDGCSIKFTQKTDLNKHIRTVHKKEKPFFCDKCGIKMAQFINLKDHRIKVHRQDKITYKDYKEMIRSGQHQFLPKESEFPVYM